ncbi:MAG: 3-deoxy-manno-octulosonate cytidylyltransferase [Bacteroidetes bacterium]|nr:MAG: 3-deoxy-manno-octulosonate cytidylyltransferase [Bacteroidota bacterium]PIE88498.1 MAG: 3-deoxy-manno-octulosonate cytidylyltransferase [Bacteroidota bacterium]
MKILGVIPARYGSTRFPGKPLVKINGKSMIMRVVEQASQCEMLTNVVVATDDQRIFEHVKEQGGTVLMTATTHQSGTERCGEVFRLMEANDSFDAVINIQGDEPFIDPRQITQVASLLQRREEVQIATLIKKTEEQADFLNPNIIKVIIDNTGKALYFSRAPIPYHRDKQRPIKGFTHVGIYGFQSDILNAITALPPALLEDTEKLEQLRWLYHGYSIHTALTTFQSKSIDTPEDLSKLIHNCT